MDLLNCQRLCSIYSSLRRAHNIASLGHRAADSLLTILVITVVAACGNGGPRRIVDRENWRARSSAKRIGPHPAGQAGSSEHVALASLFLVPSTLHTCHRV